MPLEMRKTSKWWYGRYNAGGKAHCVNLRLEIEGKRPAAISQESGDKAFERSRGKAQEKLEAMIRDVKEKKDSAEYVQKLHEIRTGRRIDSIPLGKLADEWDAAARKRAGSPRYVKQAHSLFNRFVKFIQKEYKDAETMADVTSAMAEAFMKSEKERNVSGRTYNSVLILLRSSFKMLAQKASLSRNPFAGIITATEDTIHRKPFTQAELQAILKAAEEDPFVRPLILTGMCTAMRRGDCCLLRWEDVDLNERFVRVKTGKTGETVEIPMFPLLCEELKKLNPQETGYIFPEQAKMHLKNPQGISVRVKRVLELAGFYDVDDDEKDKEKDKPIKAPLPKLPTDELLERGLRVLAEVPEDAMGPIKREVISGVFKAYVGGSKVATIAEKMGISKSTVSLYLHEMERRCEVSVIRARKKRGEKRLGDLGGARKVGIRRGSVRDFHSFRVTWITLALAAGVPMELVTRVTGHQSVDVVLKHYFRPGREDFRQAIESAMPKLLMVSNQPENQPKNPCELLEEALKGLEALPGPTGKAGAEWKQEQTRIVVLIEQAKELVIGRLAVNGTAKSA